MKTEKTKGFFWHIHHDELVEWTDDINERINYIRKNKPENEIEIRLKLMQPVKRKLPDEFVKAVKARDKAVKAWYKAQGKADKARGKADKAFVKAVKARDNYKNEIEALHKKECPDCIWDDKKLDFSKINR